MNEEDDEGWLEHWIVVGSVSEAAKAAIESVDGHVKPLCIAGDGRLKAYGVCLLYSDPPDDDVGYGIRKDDEDETICLYVSSADKLHDLIIYSSAPNPSLIQADVSDLHLMTEGEWITMMDSKNEGVQHGHLF